MDKVRDKIDFVMVWLRAALIWSWFAKSGTSLSSYYLYAVFGQEGVR